MRALLSVTTAVFALTSVVHGGIFGGKPYDVKADARIHLVPFDSIDCSGAPQQSPHEMVHGQCFNFMESLSMKPIFWKGHRADWIDEVNNLHMHCKLETFGQYHCNMNNRTIEYRFGATDEQPKNFNKCLVPTREKWEDDDSTDSDLSDEDGYARKHAIRSARFVCGPIENREHLCTSTIMHTSWSIEPTYGSPVPEVQKATYTGTLLATPHIKVKSARHAVRSAAVVAAGGESKGVWMLHPWSLSMMCYSCYTKKAHDYRKIECRGGERFHADCGPMPTAQVDGNPARHSTTTSTVTAVTTTHSTRVQKTTAYKDTTSTVTGVLLGDDTSDEEFPKLDIDLHKKKSWHTPVKFPHPFIAGRDACADAEWEKRGQGSKQYVKLQKVHFCDEKDRLDSRWLGFPTTIVHTSTATKTSSLTFSHTSTSTSTATVSTTTTTIIRHDQL